MGISQINPSREHSDHTHAPDPVSLTTKAFKDRLPNAIGHPVYVEAPYMQAGPLLKIVAKDEAVNDFFGLFKVVLRGIILYLAPLAPSRGVSDLLNYNPQESELLADSAFALMAHRM
jgi:hypothetical protein